MDPCPCLVTLAVLGCCTVTYYSSSVDPCSSVAEHSRPITCTAALLCIAADPAATAEQARGIQRSTMLNAAVHVRNIWWP